MQTKKKENICNSFVCQNSCSSGRALLKYFSAQWTARNYNGKM